MRMTRIGKVLVVFVVATAVVSVLAPNAGLVMAIVLAVVGLVALSEGMVSSGAEAGHDAWAQVEAQRKRDAMRDRR